MTTPNTDPGRSDPPRQPFQYSLASLLVVTVVFAIGCSIFFAMPAWVAVLATVAIVVSTPVALTTVLVYGQGYPRTFCIGGLFPAGICLFPFSPLYGIQIMSGLFRGLGESAEGPLRCLIFVAVYAVFVAGDGLLAVWIRRLVETRRERASERGHSAEEMSGADGIDSGFGNAAGEER